MNHNHCWIWNAIDLFFRYDKYAKEIGFEDSLPLFFNIALRIWRSRNNSSDWILYRVGKVKYSYVASKHLSEC